MTVPDINGDKKLDIAGTGPYISPTLDSSQVSVYFNDTTGNFAGTGLPVSSGPRPFGIALADINHDKNMDIVVTNAQAATQSSFTVLLNQGKGGFPTMDAPSYLSGYGSTVVTAGDLNGDGRADVVTASLGSMMANQPAIVNIYLNTTP